MESKTDNFQKYYVPEKSAIPIIFAVSVFFAGFGAANAITGNGSTMLLLGMLAVVTVSYTHLTLPTTHDV